MPPSSTLDGRAARAVRTRTAVVDALLTLLQEGDLRPTAPRIAERAGVSLRSIFQHFSDMETLFAVAGQRMVDWLETLVQPLPGDGPLGERLDAFTAQRARVLEAVTPVRRAALVHEPFSPQLQANRDRLWALARAEVESVFGPEMAAVRGARRADLLTALEVASSWPTWDALRAQCGLDPTGARRVLRKMLAALLAP